MSAPVYTYRAGVRFQKGASAPAQSVGERLEMLREQNAEQLTPEVVVADARSPGSPLNSFFEWNDAEAAEQYRLHQARNLIHSVAVTYSATEARPSRSIVAFVNIKIDDEQFYTSTVDAMSNGEYRAIVLKQAWRDLQAFRRRYGELAEFAQLFVTMDELAGALVAAANIQHADLHH